MVERKLVLADLDALTLTHIPRATKKRNRDQYNGVQGRFNRAPKPIPIHDRGSALYRLVDGRDFSLIRFERRARTFAS